MANWVPTKYFVNGLVDAISPLDVGDAVTLTTMQVFPFTNAVNLDRNTVMEDLAIPVLPGCTAASVTWASEERTSNHSLVLMSDLINFQTSSISFTPITLQGVGLSTPDALSVQQLVLACNLDEPVSIASPDDALKLVATIKIPQAEVFGGPVEIVV